MRNYVDDYVKTLRTNQRQRAANILESAKIDKIQMTSIINKLSDFSELSNIVLNPEEPGSLMAAGRVQISFRDAFLAIGEMYLESNILSLGLDSYTNVLTSDVAQLENELIALEKAIANYAFLLADGKSFDYAYFEGFSDYRGIDYVDWEIPDRAGLNFTKDQLAFVQPSEGILAIPDKIVRAYSLSARVIDSNCSSYVTSDTGVNNAVNAKSGTGWRMSVSSPSPITYVLRSFQDFYQNTKNFWQERWEKNQWFYEENNISPTLNQATPVGASVVTEFSLEQPSPCDTINIKPFADTGFELTQVVIYKDQADVNGVPVLIEPKKIDSPVNIYFPLQPVARFKLFLRQGEYNRNASVPASTEDSYRKLLDSVITDEIIRKTTSGNNNFSWYLWDIQRMTFLLYRINNSGSFYYFNPYQSGRPAMWAERNEAYILRQVMDTLKTQGLNVDTWDKNSNTVYQIKELFRNYLNNSGIILFDRVPGNTTVITPGDPQPVITGYNTQSAESLYHTPRDQTLDYEYNFGIQSISVGGSVQNYKGVFVSKKVPASGDIGELRLKAKDNHFNYVNTDKDSLVATSVEYSVTNKSRPDEEADWKPILPIGIFQIEGERFYPDSTGAGKFRFTANLDNSIVLYKNGKIVNIDTKNLLIRSPNGQTAIGLKLPIGQFTPQDIFTCDYVPSRDFSTVSFAETDFSNVPLVTSFDENGAGEGFTALSNQLIATLKFEPYIDYTKVETSSYDSELGLNPYSPLVVRFKDGSIAVNLTNYKGGGQTELDPTADQYQFIHSGNTLIFNKQVTQEFRVYYQYLLSNVRVRIVLRVNDVSAVSPTVDMFQLKAKTRKADARKVF